MILFRCASICLNEVNMNISEKLKIYADVLENEPMSKHTTYRIGGNVRYYIYPKNLLSLMRIIRILKDNKIRYEVMGRGSNVLWGDNYFDGAVINLDRYLNDSYVESDGTIVAQAGCSTINLAVEAGKNGLTGLEFATGIPGSIGGGVYMNAGAYKSDFSNILESVLVFMDDQIIWMQKDELMFGYRKSSFQSHPEWIILAAKFKCKPGNKEEILSLMDSRRERRLASQPLDKPCAGSVFRNPESIPAWKLVDDLGLRGHQIGGAQVSEKHSNFIVNAGNAKAQDVRDLIALIQKAAKESYGIDLITEVEHFNCE